MRQIFPTEKLRRKRCNTICKILSTTTVAFLLLETTFAFAQTEFEGSLNSVSITDSEGTNSPPTANFTYTQDGDTFLFDASGSTDSDGSITKYKWDFGEGTIINGVTTTYIFPDTSTREVTLAVTDNDNGISLTQQTITSSNEWLIDDDFSSDTSLDYTYLVGAQLSIANGVATYSNPNTIPTVQHNTQVGPNQMVQAKINDTEGSYGRSGLVIRSNGTTYHFCYKAPTSARVICDAKGGSGSDIYFPNFVGGTWSDGDSYSIRITTNSSNEYTLYIDWNHDGDFDDNGEMEGTKTNSNYTGSRAGFGLYSSGSYVDDFKVKAND